MDREVDQVSELMTRYARGEDAVFEQLYKAMAPRLYRFCLRLTTRRSQADDYLQETFLRLHHARAGYLSGANPLHWAFAIARSIHLDHLRCQRRYPADISSVCDLAQEHRLRADERYNPEAQVRTHELAEVVTLELHRMSEKNRAAYVLLREEELTVKEAATVLGTTPDVVKQRAHRAYEQVRSAVGAAGWRVIDHGAHNVVRVRLADPVGMMAKTERNADGRRTQPHHRVRS
jgi:RNA polymerase sigma-70 factor, ECF subfamily